LPGPLTEPYQSLFGVLSVSVGYVDHGLGGTADLPMEIRAVETESFAEAVIWPSHEAFQTAVPLLTKLRGLRSFALTNDIIPVIVNSTTTSRLLLHVGSPFTIKVNSQNLQTLHCLIVGIVDHIPTANDRVALEQGGGIGGLLADYQTYASVYAQDAHRSKNLVGSSAPPSLNQVWLHTKDDAASLASLRTALKQTQFRLSHIIDRRALLTTLQSDPLYLVLSGLLSIGTVTALVLALVGDLLTSWLNAHRRLTNFALLRALGLTPRQVASILMWEQAVVYGTGFLLGGIFGTVLSLAVIPRLTFTDLNTNLNNGEFFALQSALPTHLIVPPFLPLALLILVGISALALTMMMRVITQSVLSQALRLSED